MSYIDVYAELGERALAHGIVEVRAFSAMAARTKMSPAEIERRLLRDLETNGPIFGPFLRSITGAAGATGRAAVRQGVRLGVIDGDKELRRALEIAGHKGSLQRALEGDQEGAELADQIEGDVLDQVEHRWVCMLVNTCHRCLPLHGQEMTLAQWKERNLTPETMHEGWASECKCNLVPSHTVSARDKLLAPLRRTKVEGGKQTARAVTQADIEKAIAARDEAMQSPEGRAVLAQLGRVGAEE